MKTNIFIYGDCNSNKEFLIKSFVEICLLKKDCNLLLVDPKKVEFNAYKKFAFSGEIVTNPDNFRDIFNKFEILKGEKIMIINEISDYLYNDKYFSDFKNIILNILNNNSIIVILQTQRLSDKLDFIYNHTNISKIIL